LSESKGDRPITRQSPDEIRDAVSSYLGRRAVEPNELIGLGISLKPPRNSSVRRAGNGLVEVTIASDDETFRVECTRVVLSKYRPEITFVKERPSGPPIIKKLTPLQPARREMLNHIPNGSFISAERFYELTAREGLTQINARRRWGELRTEYRFETHYDGQSFARRSELPTSEPTPRPNTNKLMEDHWDHFHRLHGGSCNKCGSKVRYDREELTEEGEPGLLDHRRPVPFGGGDERGNLQLFCAVCNNLKATACQNCPLDYRCESCTWAHPEKFHDALVIRLSPEDAELLVELAEAEGRKPEEAAEDLFRRAFDCALDEQTGGR